jgi:hypothetical protein
MTENYNGWKNWETWNCALWMANDEAVYRMARRCDNYDTFLEVMLNDWKCDSTPDNAPWVAANREEMEEHFNELKEEASV